MSATRKLLALGLVLASLVPLSGASHVQYSYFRGSYDLGLAYMAPEPLYSLELPPNPTGVQRAVFGVMLCGESSSGQNETPSASGVGGQCPAVVAKKGDIVTITLADRYSPEVSFAACVDTDYDNECRPENPRDDLHFYMCGHGGQRNTLTFQHKGTGGPIAVFVMQQTEIGAACAAVRGTVSGVVQHLTQLPPECSDGRDNDGNGFVDWPQDPGCSDPGDDYEWTPPPTYTH